MSTLPKITIVTPSYNQGQFLEETICSVLDQKYPNLEYIVMDGGSTDNSVEIIKRYAHRLYYWRSCKDQGQSAAIADGFAMATGEILGWLNSDDMLMPNALINVAKAFLTSSGICAVTGRCVIVDQHGKPIGVYIPVIKSWRSMVSFGVGFCQMATFWKKAAYELVGKLDTEMYFSFDADLFIRLRKYGRIEAVSDYIAAYRVHKESKTTNDRPIMRVESCMIKQRYLGMNDIMARLLRVAAMFRPIRRIRDSFFWYRDKLKLIELCSP
jgi:glycosyltransferase involved in cell wall biosynthesis